MYATYTHPQRRGRQGSASESTIQTTRTTKSSKTSNTSNTNSIMEFSLCLRSKVPKSCDFPAFYCAAGFIVIGCCSYCCCFFSNAVYPSCRRRIIILVFSSFVWRLLFSRWRIVFFSAVCRFVDIVLWRAVWFQWLQFAECHFSWHWRGSMVLVWGLQFLQFSWDNMSKWSRGHHFSGFVFFNRIVGFDSIAIEFDFFGCSI